MAAGVQFNSNVHLTYFQPTVDQYLKKIQEALAANDVQGAQTALAQLKKAAISAGHATADGISTSQQRTANLNDIGAALDSGDVAWAERAVNDLRASASKSRQGAGENGGDEGSSVPDPQSDAQGDSSASGGSGDAGHSLDLKA